MSRGYESRRLGEVMRAPRPVETPDTDAATIYRQQWRRRDGSMLRTFNVLALDEEQARELGGIRLKEKYHHSILDWTLVDQRSMGHTTSMVHDVLGTEDPDETKTREEAWHRLHAGDLNPFEVRPS